MSGSYKIIDAQVKGNFTSGGSAAKGKLVLDQNGYVQINGQVSGVTQFQVGSHAISGNLLNEHTYIIAENGTAGNFVLSDKDINNNYSLVCKMGYGQRIAIMYRRNVNLKVSR